MAKNMMAKPPKQPTGGSAGGRARIEKSAAAPKDGSLAKGLNK